MFEVKVSKQIEDLVSLFLENRRKDFDLLHAAIVAKDFTVLIQIGHRLKGVGASYGFEQISAAGRAIEAAARDGDEALLTGLIDDYGNYLGRLKVTYGE